MEIQTSTLYKPQSDEMLRGEKSHPTVFSCRLDSARKLNTRHKKFGMGKIRLFLYGKKESIFNRNANFIYIQIVWRKYDEKLCVNT